jgi:hypothetical protein
MAVLSLPKLQQVPTLPGELERGGAGLLGLAKGLQDIKTQDFLNKIRQAQAGIAPQLAQAQVSALPFQRKLLEAKVAQIPATQKLLEAQAQLPPAQAALAQAQAQALPQDTRIKMFEAQTAMNKALEPETKTPLGQAILDHQVLTSMFGENSPEVIKSKQNINNLINSGSQPQTEAETAMLKKQGQNWADMVKTSTDMSDKARDAEEQINQFTNAYNKLSPAERGPGFGYFSALTSNGQLARKAQNRLALSLLGMQKFGRVTNKEMNIVQNSTLNTHMNPQAAQTLGRELKLIAKREQEYPKFLAALQNNGVTNSGIARTLWDHYIHQYPAVDIKNNLHPENLPKWREYIGKGAIQSVKSGEVLRGAAPSQEDLEFTARKYGISVDEVKRRLGTK